MFDIVGSVELVGRWWNGERGGSARRDIWLIRDGARWHVRAREGANEVAYAYDREYEARAMVDRMIATARPRRRWKDLTKVVRRPDPRCGSPGGDVADDAP